MSGKKPRSPRPALPPPGMRPKLTREQVVTLGVLHHEHFGAICRGEAGRTEMLTFAGSVLTWSRIAELTPRWDDEVRATMGRGLDVLTSLVGRFASTGKVGFSGPELVQAREVVALMDAMAGDVERHTALQACEWSEGKLAAMPL